MDFGKYLEIDAVNWSTLKHIGRSPLHYRWIKEHPIEDRVIFMRGRCIHTALLEQHKLADEYVVYQGKTRQGKKWDEFKTEHAGKTILKADEFEKAIRAAAAVRRHPEAAAMLAEGVPEGTIQWTDGETGLFCKGRVDWNGGVILDVKTTVDIDARKFGNTAAALSYHGQLAFYRDGANANDPTPASGSKPAFIVAVEREPPYDVACFQLDEDALFAGRELYRSYLRQLVDCRASDLWPGRYPNRQALQLPKYVYADPEQEDGTMQVMDADDQEVD